MTQDRSKDRHDKSLVRRTIRLTPENAKLVKTKAALMGISVNQYINFLIQNNNLKVTQKFKYSDQEAERIRRELVYLHRNFNQYNVELNRVLAKQADEFEVKNAIQKLDKLTAAVNRLSDQVEPNQEPASRSKLLK